MLAVDRTTCLMCAGCISLCPEAALSQTLAGLVVAQDRCTLCGICTMFCPVTALAVADEADTPVGEGV